MGAATDANGSAHTPAAQPAGRAFIVGCPRSGTSLLNQTLGRHPRIAAQGETKFLRLMIPANRRWARRLGLASRRAGPAYRQLARALARVDPETASSIERPRIGLRIADHVGAFVRTMDRSARARARQLWIEKTPEHLDCIPEIERHVPDAKFIHLIRSGSDVVASLYDVTRTHKDDWWGFAWPVEYCVYRWNQDVRISLERCAAANHMAVLYEDLVADPRRELARVCDFLGVPFDEALVGRPPSRNAERPASAGYRGYHSNLARPIQNLNGSRRLDELFDDAERAHIAAHLLDYDALRGELRRRMEVLHD